MAFDRSEFLEYYEGLLIIQYSLKSRAKSTIKLLANQSCCDEIIEQLETAFDLDTAVGEQLTILGRIVGIPRYVYGLDLQNTYFNFTNYSEESSTGFGLYSDSPYSLDLFLRYTSFAIYYLSDFEIRTLIKIKIIQNNVLESTKDIVEAFYDIFGSDVVVTDNLDMSITYDVSELYTSVILAAQFLDVLPKPMGVSTTVNLV